MARILVLFFLFLAIFYITFTKLPKIKSDLVVPEITNILSSPTPVSPKSKVKINQPIDAKIIPQKLHIFQTFNNCGPATLSMQLSYFDVNVTQAELGQKLRPYQIPKGDNDDKSVTFPELLEEAETYGLVGFTRPNGNIAKLKSFIANDIPVATRTWTKLNEDIGHYRLVRGYDDKNKQIIQDDSLQGKNLRFSYGNFLKLWQGFNYEYLILVPKEKEQVALAILGEESDEKVAYQNALERAQQDIIENPEIPYPLFNQSINYYYLGEHKKSVEVFESVQRRLPWRMLWYQIQPIYAYAQLKNYQKVFSLTDSILNNHNRAFSELYIIRAKAYEEQGQIELARKEYQNAVLYNKNFSSQIPIQL